MAVRRKATLLELVRAVDEYATSDRETVATVAYLINSGKVVLCGTFAGARIDVAAAPGVFARPVPPAAS